MENIVEYITITGGPARFAPSMQQFNADAAKAIKDGFQPWGNPSTDGE
ncbi:MAG: hypothetical protein ABJF10_07375 [Chthoniobacter sp.]